MKKKKNRPADVFIKIFVWFDAVVDANRNDFDSLRSELTAADQDVAESAKLEATGAIAEWLEDVPEFWVEVNSWFKRSFPSLHIHVIEERPELFTPEDQIWDEVSKSVWNYVFVLAPQPPLEAAAVLQRRLTNLFGDDDIERIVLTPIDRLFSVGKSVFNIGPFQILYVACGEGISQQHLFKTALSQSVNFVESPEQDSKPEDQLGRICELTHGAIPNRPMLYFATKGSFIAARPTLEWRAQVVSEIRWLTMLQWVHENVDGQFSFESAVQRSGKARTPEGHPMTARRMSIEPWAVTVESGTGVLSEPFLLCQRDRYRTWSAAFEDPLTLRSRYNTSRLYAEMVGEVLNEDVEAPGVLDDEAIQYDGSTDNLSHLEKIPSELDTADVTIACDRLETWLGRHYDKSRLESSWENVLAPLYDEISSLTEGVSKLCDKTQEDLGKIRAAKKTVLKLVTTLQHAMTVIATSLRDSPSAKLLATVIACEAVLAEASGKREGLSERFRLWAAFTERELAQRRTRYETAGLIYTWRCKFVHSALLSEPKLEGYETFELIRMHGDYFIQLALYVVRFYSRYFEVSYSDSGKHVSDELTLNDLVKISGLKTKAFEQRTVQDAFTHHQTDLCLRIDDPS